MTKSNIQKKFENLYKNIDPQSRKQDDKALIRDELASIKAKEQWESGSLSREKNKKSLIKYNKSKAYKISQANSVKAAQDPSVKKKRWDTKKSKGLIRDHAVYDKIYEESWGPDRGAKLYKKLATKYKTQPGTVHSVANGALVGNNENYKKRPGHDKRLNQWQLDHGNLQWWWVVYEADKTKHKFETQADANRFVCEVKGIDPEKFSGIAFDLFKSNKPKTAMSREFKGWVFEKIERKTKKVVNGKARY